MNGIYNIHYFRKNLDGFNFGQKKCPKIKPSEILNIRKLIKKKSLQMAGIVEVVTKELGPEVPFKILDVD